ncbi:unnamed protein product [Allacma fusca]|uniref:Uncharacterized protein n=1 Tax=Allacma fusca TaxID=39272 RepID=A0A8J2Q4R8_9HEXA|nr:unnamed protein product [Allacma fusca]
MSSRILEWSPEPHSFKSKLYNNNLKIPKGARGFKVASAQSQKPQSNMIKVQNLDIHYMTVGTGENFLVCLPGTLGFAQLDYGFLMKG